MSRRRRRTWGRTFDPDTAEKLAGRLAWFDGDCERCPEPIVRHQSQVVPAPHGGWIHAGCASGATDE